MASYDQMTPAFIDVPSTFVRTRTLESRIY